MQKIHLIITILTIQFISFFNVQNEAKAVTTVSDFKKLYSEMQLDNVVNYTVFEKAIIGYNKLDAKNKEIITLIDFSKPSNEERFHVLDLKNKKVLYSTVVAHGRNSGDKYATSFSNKNGSHKSSLGFYVTEGTYDGRNGYSLVLNGLEKGINDNAKERAIVIHAASYANPTIAKKSGRIGRSHGCPALPESLNKEVINTIKNGTLLFIYGNDNSYLTNSSIL